MKLELEFSSRAENIGIELYTNFYIGIKTNTNIDFRG
jgi:hypothetical protein